MPCFISSRLVIPALEKIPRKMINNILKAILIILKVILGILISFRCSTETSVEQLTKDNLLMMMQMKKTIETSSLSIYHFDVYANTLIYMINISTRKTEFTMILRIFSTVMHSTCCVCNNLRIY